MSETESDTSPRAVLTQESLRAVVKPHFLREAAYATRPLHWVKNLLLFVPLIAAHELLDTERLVRVVLAFGAFCLIASGSYVVNDLVDAESDRLHATKRNRAVARRAFSRGKGWGLSLALAIGGFAAGAAVSGSFLLFVASYLSVVVLYTLKLKASTPADVFVLAGFYILRIFAGADAAGIPVSFWLTAASACFFLSLALIKRFAELASLARDRFAIPGRDYSSADLPLVAAAGIASGYMSVVVLALYINSAEVKNLYANPGFLWTVCALAQFWLTRIWLLAGRNRLPCDPVLFAVKDRTSYLIAGAALLSCLLAARKF